MKVLRISIQILLVLVLIGAGLAGFRYMTGLRQATVRKNPPQRPPAVRVVTARTGPVTVTVKGEGTVRPVRESTLAAQVAGRVVYVSPNLAVGGSCAKDEVLLRIDPTDYRLALTLSQAQLKEAEYKLDLTREEAAAAVEEWKQLRQAKPPALVAKVPQMAQAKAGLDAARARVRQAELDLKRTQVVAPFEGRISTKQADLGQYLNRGQTVAGLYSVEAVEVTVNLEDRDLAWFSVPGLTAQPNGDQGSMALVKASFAGQELQWQGRVVRSEAQVDQRTRLVPVVVRVERPFEELPPLSVGLFVRVEIRGRTQPRATLLPRAALRQGDLIWLVNDGRIRFREVKVLRRQADQVLISPGLPDGSQVVLSGLKAVSQGMAVRSIPGDPPAGQKAEGTDGR